MSNKTAKPHRNLANRVGSPFPFARIRRWTDRLGLNFGPQQIIDKCNEELLALNKLNGPVKPTPPTKLDIPADATVEQTETAKKDHDAALAAFKQEWSAWKEYSSSEYNQTTKVFMFYKNMKRLTELLRREEQTESSAKERSNLLDILHDKPAYQGRRESEEDYKNRVEKFVSPGYLELLNQFTNLDDANAIDLVLNNLRAANPNIEKFLRKEESSREKTRFNDTGLIAISTGCEEFVSECARFAMRNALIEGKKIIQPDHVLDGIKDSPLYHMFSTLPHFTALVERSKRRVAHELSNNEKRQNLFKEARQRAHNDGRPYRKEDSPDLKSLKTFEDDEVAIGNAIKVDIPPSKKSKTNEQRITYLWRGVEYDEGEPDSTNFDYYVAVLCKAIKDSEFSGNKDAEGIKVSKHIKQFLSKLITDFLARLAPVFRILIEYNQVKTVEGSTVVAAYKLMFADSYCSRNGNINWIDAHKHLFDTIQTRLDMWRTMSASAKAYVEQEADATDLSDGVADPLEADEDESKTAAPAPEPTLVDLTKSTTAVRRGQVTRNR
jgi:hypothetical protein